MARMSLRMTLLALATAGLVAWVAPPPALAKSAEVVLRNRRFEPAEAKIEAGDEVAWTNRDKEEHTVTFVDGEYDSSPSCRPGGLLLIGCMAPDDTVRHRFTREGEFRYTCRLHPQMKGVVTVRGGATPTTVAATTTTEAPTTTTTTRPLTTSSAPVAPTTVSTGPPSTFEPGSPPLFNPGGGSTTTAATRESESAGPGPRPPTAGDRGGGTDGGTVFAIVAGLAAVSLGGGYLLLRMRPRRN